MKGWFVVRTHHKREPWACENISRQGADYYLPLIIENTRTSRKKGPAVVEARPRSLFPGYVFVKTEGQWRFLLGTFGVIGVIMQGADPAVVPEQIIADLRAREDANGIIQLPGRPEGLSSRFKVGDQVRVAEGPYSGYIGIYDGVKSKEREQVLLDFLGRKTRVLIGIEHLESV